jgi:hypothetical protein
MINECQIFLRLQEGIFSDFNVTFHHLFQDLHFTHLNSMKWTHVFIEIITINQEILSFFSKDSKTCLPSPFLVLQ